MTPSWDLISLLRSKGYAAMVSGAGPCVLVLHYGDASEEIGRIVGEKLALGSWKVLHLPVDTRGVDIERR